MILLVKRAKKPLEKVLYLGDISQDVIIENIEDEDYKLMYLHEKIPVLFLGNLNDQINPTNIISAYRKIFMLGNKSKLILGSRASYKNKDCDLFYYTGNNPHFSPMDYENDQDEGFIKVFRALAISPDYPEWTFLNHTQENDDLNVYDDEDCLM